MQGRDGISDIEKGNVIPGSKVNFQETEKQVYYLPTKHVPAHTAISRMFPISQDPFFSTLS